MESNKSAVGMLTGVIVARVMRWNPDREPFERGRVKCLGCGMDYKPGFPVLDRNSVLLCSECCGNVSLAAGPGYSMGCNASDAIDAASDPEPDPEPQAQACSAGC